MRKLLLTLLFGLIFAVPSHAFILEDGKGTGNKAQVNKENQLVVRSISQSELEHTSEKDGEAYSWASDAVDPGVDETVLLIKNTSDTPLHLGFALISGSTSSQYTVHLPTTEVTPTGGSVVTGTNLNTGSSNVADASARSLETNNSQGNVIHSIFILADTPYFINLDGIILAKNKSIGVDVVANTTLSSVTIVGHYED